MCSLEGLKEKFRLSSKCRLSNKSLDLVLLSKCQIKWEIVSNYVSFLENLNFNVVLEKLKEMNKHSPFNQSKIKDNNFFNF